MSIYAYYRGGEHYFWSRSLIGPCGITTERPTKVGSFEIVFKSGIPHHTWTNIEVDSDSFEEVAQAMMRASPSAAIKAFGAAMQAVELGPISKAAAA
jgi:hypothetical protein